MKERTREVNRSTWVCTDCGVRISNAILKNTDKFKSCRGSGVHYYPARPSKLEEKDYIVAPARYELAWVKKVFALLELGKFNAALELYDKVLEISPRARGKRVWWKCSEGHEWEAFIQNRTRGSGCPICARARARML